MAECTQEAFLDGIRQALANHDEKADLPEDLGIARVIKSTDDVVQTFITRVDEAKMHLYCVADESGIAETVTRIVQKVEGKSAVVPTEELPARQEILAALQTLGVEMLNADDRDEPFAADIGITGVDLAVAETASLYMTSGGGRRRLASLAPPCHIALLRREQIVADLLDWAEKAPRSLQAGGVLVSGPSKTADIELQLVIGVHGPREEHIILIG